MLTLRSHAGHLLAAACLAMTASPLLAVDAGELEMQFRQKHQQAIQAGHRPDIAMRTAMADELLADADVASISLDTLTSLCEKLPLQGTDFASRMDVRLKTMAEEPTAQGARAAALRLRFAPRDMAEVDRANLILAAIDHRGFAEALAAGHATEPITATAWLSGEQLAAAHAKIVGLADHVSDAWSPLVFDRFAGGFFGWTPKIDDAQLSRQEPLRAALVQSINARLASNPGDAAAALTAARDRLDGAFVKGKLVDHPAPELDFLWWHNPQNPDEKVTSLADLKGKVVVLDFWATWCGPCIASFPRVKALQTYYEGFDVVIIGVTSPQGFTFTGAGQRVDTAGDPEREFALMPEFMQAREVTWPVAFSSQPVFNPDYGITGIPHMVILDTDGVVRYRGMHPGGSLDEKTSKITPLLLEGGRNIPAIMMQPRNFGDQF